MIFIKKNFWCERLMLMNISHVLYFKITVLYKQNSNESDTNICHYNLSKKHHWLIRDMINFLYIIFQSIMMINIFKHFLQNNSQVNAKSWFNIVSGNGLLLLGNKPAPGPMWSKFYGWIWKHQGQMGSIIHYSGVIMDTIASQIKCFHLITSSWHDQHYAQHASDTFQTGKWCKIF